MGSKNATKSFNKSFLKLVKYLFFFYFVNFCFFHYSKTIFKLCCTRLILIQTNIYVKPYTNMQISCCRRDKTMVSDNFKRNLHHFKMKKIERHTGKQGPRTLEDPGPLRTQDPRGPRTFEDPGP